MMRQHLYRQGILCHTKAFFVLRIGVVWGGVSQLIEIEFEVL